MNIDEHLRELLDATPDAMVAVDESGHIVWTNRQCDLVFGYASDELVGQRHEVLVPEDQRVRHEALRRTYLGHPITRPMAADLALEARRRDGSTFPAEISLSASEGSDGMIVLAAVRDVTERNEAERQLQAARAHAEAAELANRAKDEFLSRVSHELRTPLNAILGFAQLLKHSPLTGAQVADVDHIDRAGHHLLDLINDVLDISRIESGQLALSPEPVALVEVVDDVVTLLGPLASDRDIRVNATGARADAVDLHVRADRQRLKQILVNLLSNAIKYNVRGGEVEVRWAAVGDRVHLSVADTGPGIPKALMDRLFMPFDRLGADRSVTEGVGLGLALSSGLAQLMDGELTASSRPGEGAMFRLDLPRTEPPARPAHREVLPASPAAPEIDRFGILYVEDNRSNIELMQRIVALRPGVELVTAMQGRQARELAECHRPDLILLDLHLPDMEGHEVLAELLALPAAVRAPVVVVSADASPQRVRRLIDRGAASYITKPIELAPFLDLLDSFVAAKRSGSD